MHDEKSRREAMMPEEQSLADRADARITKAESDFAVAKHALEAASVVAAQAKTEHDELHKLTATVKNLAPLIRDEVNSLERLCRHAEERKAKLADAVETTNKELKSLYLAREQLKQIGLYLPSDARPVEKASPRLPRSATT